MANGRESSGSISCPDVWRANQHVMSFPFCSGRFMPADDCSTDWAVCGFSKSPIVFHHYIGDNADSVCRCVYIHLTIQREELKVHHAIAGIHGCSQA